jgi:two-component system chemotaxis sensor kinase CheA
MADEFDLSQFKEIFVSEAKEHLSSMNANLLELEKNPLDKDLLNEIFRLSHTLKGMSATMGYEKLAGLTHEMENVLDVYKKGKMTAGSETVDVLFSCFDTLEQLLEEIVTGEDKQVQADAVIQQLKSVIETKPETKSELKPKLESQPAVEPQVHLSTNPDKAVQQDTAGIEQEPEVHVAKIKTQTVRLKVEHLDRLMNFVGELVIIKARLLQIGQLHRITEFTGALSQFDRISIDLQEEVLKTRMVPVNHIFDRYPRMVRDLAKRLNKEIDFQLFGSDIEIDRTLLEEINEPLVHLLRNAVDHGIETVEDRQKNGKSLTGLVKLSAKRERGFCLIEIADDGKGMSADDIRQKAVEKGIVTIDESKVLSDDETLMLICHPSFSMAKQITDISGRGVGMDVVKNLVESFNGKLEIRSRKGEGTTFVLHLPLTLAIIQALLVTIAGETYAVPLTNVTEIARIDVENIKTVGTKEVLYLRNEIIPLIRLAKVYTHKNKTAVNTGQDTYAVLVEIRDKKVALAVTHLVGRQEIVIKTLPGMLKHSKNFSGATILGDGQAILIIDINSTIS